MYMYGYKKRRSRLRVFVGRRGRAVVDKLLPRIFPLITGLSICHFANSEFVRRAPPKIDRHSLPPFQVPTAMLLIF